MNSGFYQKNIISDRIFSISGIQCIIGRYFFSSGFEPDLLDKELFSQITSSVFPENSYVGLGVPFSPISLRIFEM